MSEFGFSTGSSTLDWLPIDASSSYEWWGRSKVCSKIWHIIKSNPSNPNISPKSFKWFWLEQMHQASSKVCQGKHVQMETICRICLHLSWCLSCCRLFSLPADRIVVHDFFIRTLETQHLKSKSAIYRDPSSAATIKHEDRCNIDCPCQTLFWFVPKLWMPKI